MWAARSASHSGWCRPILTLRGARLMTRCGLITKFGDFTPGYWSEFSTLRGGNDPSDSLVCARRISIMTAESEPHPSGLTAEEHDAQAGQGRHDPPHAAATRHGLRPTVACRARPRSPERTSSPRCRRSCAVTAVSPSTTARCSTSARRSASSTFAADPPAGCRHESESARRTGEMPDQSSSEIAIVPVDFAIGAPTEFESTMGMVSVPSWIVSGWTSTCTRAYVAPGANVTVPPLVS